MKHTHIQFAFVLTAMGILSFILSYGCSLEEPENRDIRAHVVSFDGVAHGARAEFGPRYCKECHGAELAGGESGEPSCFQCHGVNWKDIEAEDSRAPSDHTQIEEGFLHHPSLNSPNSVCANCHGQELQGDESQNTPSCYLCHDSLWD